MADVVGAAGLGFVAYVLLTLAVVVHGRVMPIQFERAIEMHAVVEVASQSEIRPIFMIGSSVPLSGIDARIVDERLPDGVESFNLAWTGGTPTHWCLLAPAIRRARPEAVVLCVDLAGASIVEKPPRGLLAVADWWGFVDREDVERFRDVLGDETCKGLLASRLECLLEFRTFPPGALDGYFREIARSDLRYEGHAKNAKDPWVRNRAIPEASMERSMRNWRARLESSTEDSRRRALDVIQSVVRYFREANVNVVVVFTPIHPGLLTSQTTTIRRDLAQMCSLEGAAFLDHTAAISAAGLADPVHAYGEGRAAWSRRLGDDLAVLLKEAKE